MKDVKNHAADSFKGLMEISSEAVVYYEETDSQATSASKKVILNVNGRQYQVTCLSIGNPHCVIPLPEVSESQTKTVGPWVECHPLFPNRINVQFVQVIDRHTLDIRIWERGAGYTLASGSSACAAAAASHKLSLVDSPINVCMPGGSLRIDINATGLICMTGPVEKVFEGCLTSLPVR